MTIKVAPWKQGAEMATMASPRGCRFAPNDLELIQYLLDKISGCPDPGQGFINNDVDVYSTSPHLLPPAGEGDGKLFCFTPIKFRKEPTCRDRSTPYGHWKAKNGKNTVQDDDGNPVGFTQTFSYHLGKKEGLRTKWIMKEYTIFSEEPQTVALCVVYSSANKSYPKPVHKLRSRPSHGISMVYSSDVGACSGELNVVDNNGGCFRILQKGYPAAAGVATQSHGINAKCAASLSGFPTSSLEEVNSPRLDLEL